MRISDWSSDVCSSDLDESPDWRNWLQAAGVSGIDVQRGPGFSDSSMVVEAAAAGQGVALGHRWLAAADLESGRIVMPFGPVDRKSTRLNSITNAHPVCRIPLEQK